ncbi:MAG: CoA transferase [Ottowia sp.]|uniref:CaiB/BaiF CoA transferase family protein n=1 Tax=Ottowia sp. TaxID=1898956 RepID=UPI0039E50853
MTDTAPARSGPLAGVRIIDVTAVLMGPSATQMLGDLGADVIKIEPPGGDKTRAIGPMGDRRMGPIFLSVNRNKRSLVLDLKAPEGREALFRLAETADVLTYNVRPAAMARLGLTYEALSERNPRLIYVGMFGFSQRGRYAPSPAFDDLIQAATGVTAAMAASSPDGSAGFVPLNMMDRSVGLYGFGVIASALYAREKTGRGQRVDVPMFETMVPYVLGDHLYGHKYQPAQGGFGYPRILSTERRPFRTKDAQVCCVIYQDHHWRAFLGILGMGELYDTDPRFKNITSRTAHADELYRFVETHLAEKTTAEWQQLLKDADVPVFPVHTFQSVLEDGHLQDIGFFREEDVPGIGTMRETAVPSEWFGTPPEGYRPPPTVGQHSAEVLAEAGYSVAEIDRLVQSGVTRVGA